MNNTFTKARALVYRNARPIELTRWQYHFEGGSKDAVLTVLSQYQNQDGGFGHALEPDSWNPNSSPIQTWEATQVLYNIDWQDATHPIVQNILRYLASGQEFNGKRWYGQIESNNDYPHAPWWGWKPYEEQSYNPTACLAGFIVKFANKDGDLYKLGCRIVREADTAYREPVDMHTAMCYLKMWQYCKQAEATDLIDLDDLEQRLRKQAKHIISQNKEAWKTEYVCTPIWFANTPESIFYADNKELFDYQCEYIVDYWENEPKDVPWSWDGYPEEFAISKNRLKVYDAIKHMLYLRNFGKIK